MIQVFRTTGLPQKCCHTLPFQQLLQPRECSLAGEGQQGAQVPGKIEKKNLSSRTQSYCFVLFSFYLIPNNSLDTLTTANVMTVLLFDCLPLIVHVLSLRVHDSSSLEESLFIWSTTNSKQIYF